MTKSLKNVKNEKCPLKDLEYGDYENMTSGMLNKYYELHVFRNINDISLSHHVLCSYPVKIYKHVKLVHAEGLREGQAYFITDDGSYLMLPWCYIISMAPSLNKEK